MPIVGWANLPYWLVYLFALGATAFAGALRSGRLGEATLAGTTAAALFAAYGRVRALFIPESFADLGSWTVLSIIGILGLAFQGAIVGLLAFTVLRRPYQALFRRVGGSRWEMPPLAPRTPVGLWLLVLFAPIIGIPLLIWRHLSPQWRRLLFPFTSSSRPP
jgi:hypothetical protein